MLELPNESIFLVKACEGQPLEQIDFEKNAISFARNETEILWINI